MSTATWDATTASGTAVHVADWKTGRALCGAYVVPVSTSADPDAWRPRCRRCIKAAGR